MIHTFMYLTYTKWDTSPFTWVCDLKGYYYKLIIFNLLQILYLLGVGLLLIFDLLACVDSTGMLYHNSAKFCAKVLHMHILCINWCLYWSLGNLYLCCVSSVIRYITFQKMPCNSQFGEGLYRARRQVGIIWVTWASVPLIVSCFCITWQQLYSSRYI